MCTLKYGVLTCQQRSSLNGCLCNQQQQHTQFNPTSGLGKEKKLTNIFNTNQICWTSEISSILKQPHTGSPRQVILILKKNGFNTPKHKKLLPISAFLSQLPRSRSRSRSHSHSHSRFKFLPTNQESEFV